MSTELPRRQRATGTRAKICIVASEYNEQYTQALVENCSEELKTVLPSVRLEIIRVPGAFEIPVSIKSVLSRSPEKRPDAVVALGVILRGSTDHADLIGLDYCLDKEAHETKLGSVPFPEFCMELFAEFHHGGHVAFVEGSQDGRLVLGLYQPCRDGTAQRAHGFSDEARRSLLSCFPIFSGGCLIR